MPPAELLACCMEALDGGVEWVADGAPDWPQPAVSAVRARISVVVIPVTACRLRNLVEPPAEGCAGDRTLTVRVGKPTGITSRQLLVPRFRCLVAWLTG